MARIAGVDLPRDKRVEIGLTYIYGIGLTLSKKILGDAEINPDIRFGILQKIKSPKSVKYWIITK